MPLALEYFHTRMAGVSDRDAGYDAKLNFDCLREATVRFGWDWAPGMAVPPSRSLEALGSKQIRWPGGDLPDDVQFQWVEDEYLKADEYDAFLSDPTRFTLHTLWPRLAERLRRARRAAPAACLVDQHHVLPAGLGGAAGGAPDDGHVRGARGDEPGRRRLHGGVRSLHGPDGRDGVPGRLRRRHQGALRHRVRRLPWPARQHARPVPAAGQAAGADGDADADGHRRRPSAPPRASGNPRVFIPLHRGAAGFLNDEQFAKYYWPGLKAVIFALLEAGVTPCPFFEGDYTPRLKYLAELPPGVVAAHFDRTDRKKFKEMCGHNLCFWGDVPGSLMVTGKPREVKDYVKGLIEDFGDTGGLIVDGANPSRERPSRRTSWRCARPWTSTGSSEGRAGGPAAPPAHRRQREGRREGAPPVVRSGTRTAAGATCPAPSPPSP